MTLRRNLVLFFAAALLATALAADPPLAVYLVRHAEKVDQSRDADLSELGLRRAEALRGFFAKIPLEGVFATQFQRTQKTVGPLARERGLDVALVDAGQGERLVERLRAAGSGTYLISGHSNTVPWLIERLGGPSLTIRDDEYDNVFLLVLWNGQTFFQQFQLTLTDP